MEEHTHDFSSGDWLFSDVPNTATFTIVPVLRQGHPILVVSHDSDGDWQFLCGATTESKDGLILCLGCAFERDRSLGLLADLPQGWQATRNPVTYPWQRWGPDRRWWRFWRS